MLSHLGFLKFPVPNPACCYLTVSSTWGAMSNCCWVTEWTRAALCENTCMTVWKCVTADGKQKESGRNWLGQEWLADTMKREKLTVFTWLDLEWEMGSRETRSWHYFKKMNPVIEHGAARWRIYLKSLTTALRQTAAQCLHLSVIYLSTFQGQSKRASINDSH